MVYVDNFYEGLVYGIKGVGELVMIFIVLVLVGVYFVLDG